MRNVNSGKIISSLRIDYKISLKVLAKGLCSISTLSRIEMCERIPDKLLLDAILQRLGKSSDKLEVVMTMSDHKLYLQREEIEESIIGGDYKKAKNLLDGYSKKREAREAVHKQYILKIKAVLYELDDKDIEKSREYIEMAIRTTMKEGEEYALENSLLSKTEIQLILMKIYHCRSKEEYKKVFTMLEKLNEYVKQHYTDEEEMAKIYAKIVRVEAKILLEEKRYEKAGEICKLALDLLGKNDLLLDFYEILVMYIESLEHIDHGSDILRKMKKWEMTLNELYEEYEIQLPKGSMGLLTENSQCEILLLSEIFKRERKAKGLSQEQLCQDICTPETISAIENGRRAPTLKNYDKLVKRLGISKDFYNSFLSTEKFEIHELRRECNRLIYLKRYDEAELLLKKMEHLIDITIPVNEQYIVFNQTLIQYNKKEISKEDALDNAIYALELTFEYNDGNFAANSNFSQEEVKIFNFIGIVYKHLGDLKKAVNIYKKVLKSYETSKVSVRGHYFGSSLIMANLCTNLELINETKESMEIAQQGIKQELECGRATMVPVFLANKVSCLEKEGDKNKKTCMKYLQQAFYVSDMIKNENFKSATEKYYIKFYGEIKWY